MLRIFLEKFIINEFVLKIESFQRRLKQIQKGEYVLLGRLLTIIALKMKEFNRWQGNPRKYFSIKD